MYYKRVAAVTKKFERGDYMRKLIRTQYLPNLKSIALLIDSINLHDILYTLMFNAGIVSLCNGVFVEQGELILKKTQKMCYTLVTLDGKTVCCLNFAGDGYKKTVEEISRELRKNKISLDYFFVNSLGIAGTLIDAKTQKVICSFNSKF